MILDTTTHSVKRRAANVSIPRWKIMDSSRGLLCMGFSYQCTTEEKARITANRPWLAIHFPVALQFNDTNHRVFIRLDNQISQSCFFTRGPKLPAIGIRNRTSYSRCQKLPVGGRNGTILRRVGVDTEVFNLSGRHARISILSCECVWPPPFPRRARTPHRPPR